MQVTKIAPSNGKKFKKEDIVILLQRPDAQIKGLVRIFEMQEADEQQVEHTRHWNKVGFTGADSKILTSLAKQVVKKLAYNKLNKTNFPLLSEKQLLIVSTKITKYAGQLAKIANGEIKAYSAVI